MSSNDWSVDADFSKQEPFIRHDSIIEPQNAPQYGLNHNDDCILYTIPKELRNLIYHQVLLEPDGVHLHFGSAGNSTVLAVASALSRTNQFIRAESKDMLFRLNIFHFHVPVLQEPVRPDPTSTSNSTHRRHARASSSSQRSSSASSARHLRRVSEEFRDMAVMVPSAHACVAHLDCTLARLPGPLNSVWLHLGTHTHTVFVPAFHNAWTAMLPGMQILRNRVPDLRIIFALRLSRRLSVSYGFGVSGSLAQALREMDAGLLLDGSRTWKPTLPEMTAVNEVRRKVAETFWPAEDAGHWSGME